MKKWEYKIAGNPSNLLFMEYKQLLDKNYNRWGDDGWELVTVSNGIAFFKRPVKAMQEQDE